MVTDAQVRRLLKDMEKGQRKTIAAVQAGMSERTARKYARSRLLPSEIKAVHDWRTRTDPFEEVWDGLKKRLGTAPGLEAKTLFEDLVERYPGRFTPGQLRTLQRKIKRWRAEEGPAKRVFFPQVHHPGVLCESDFTRMGSLGITICGLLFDHLIYHFVLTYSNWETGTICFSESFESVSEGLQNALWELGGVPEEHQTDCLTAAVRNTKEPGAFTDRYEALLRYYQIAGRRTNPSSPHENGDIESRNNHFKRSLDQALLLRGTRDFESRESYEEYLRVHFVRQNSKRLERFSEEQRLLRPLPARRLESSKRERVRVGPSSTIRVKHNTYSVNSRLVGEWVEAQLYHERIEIWYGQKQVETLPRLRGEGNHCVQYRHIIDYLMRKPGAFRNYRYRSDMFPTIGFRVCYDALKRQRPTGADKEYLKILHLAAQGTEAPVECAINHLLATDERLSAEAVAGLLAHGSELPSVRDVAIDEVALSTYDELLSELEPAA
jgi:hypothetical protein